MLPAPVGPGSIDVGIFLTLWLHSLTTKFHDSRGLYLEPLPVLPFSLGQWLDTRSTNVDLQDASTSNTEISNTWLSATAFDNLSLLRRAWIPAPCVSSTPQRRIIAPSGTTHVACCACRIPFSMSRQSIKICMRYWDPYQLKSDARRALFRVWWPRCAYRHCWRSTKLSLAVVAASRP